MGYLYYSSHYCIGNSWPTSIGRDILINLKFVADWKGFRLRKQKDVDRNNSKENSLRISHNYQVGGKVVMIFTER